MANITIEYRLHFEDNSDEVIKLELDEATLELVEPFPNRTPDWALLRFHQCANCPLDADDVIYCPVARNLSTVVRRFDGVVSYEDVDLEVVTDERRISQRTRVQHAVGSLLGLLFATSGCPHTVFFKPMARFHLPLASKDETAYRATSMYLLAQYFVHLDGGEPDFELDGLAEIYRNIQEVNIAIALRMRAAVRTDSSINGVILLDMFAKSVPLAIRQSLENIRHLFSAWQERDSGAIE